MLDYNQPMVIYTWPISAEYSASTITPLANEFDFHSVKHPGLDEIISWIGSNVLTKVTVIVFDLSDLNLHLSTGSNIHDIINALNTLTRIRNSPSGPASIAVTVPSDISLAQITELQDSGVRGIILASEWTGPHSTERRQALDELLSGRKYVSPSISEKIKQSKKKKITISNGIQLTARQSQISKLVCSRGLSNKSIAKILNISESTVKLHVSAVLRKYGARNRTQLALFAKNDNV